jgi:predicted naringenin-chalcone synthase
LAKIVSIATNVPDYQYSQADIVDFIAHNYKLEETEKRKLSFLYNTSGTQYRYAVIEDLKNKRTDTNFYYSQTSPTLAERMVIYNKYAAPLCSKTIQECIKGKITETEITHLITVSCTGMSAPGLDLQIVKQMNLPSTINRTSINFMGCYAAIHALKMADGIIASNENANVIIVCLEFCSLHFQYDNTIDNIRASMLFGDGCAALLVQKNNSATKGFVLQNFYSQIALKGEKDMAWELSGSGFLMKLTSYVTDLIEEDFEQLVSNALAQNNLEQKDITHWCIHPGGKKILEAIEKSLSITKTDLEHSYTVLKNYGNMSSPTILFVLQQILQQLKGPVTNNKIFGAAFGPGLTMETFLATYE